jgi:Fe-S-cluster containining protein
MELGKHLLRLYDEVQGRNAALAEAHPSWPCARGCGACCSTLARVPELTRSEWLLFEAALLALPEAERRACLTAAHRLGEQLRQRALATRAAGRDPSDEGPCACPLYNAAEQVCRVYAARPLACRSYGFYAGRSHDAWCSLVATHVAEVRDSLVLGNHDALEARLLRLDGERRDLLAWLGIPWQLPPLAAA